MNNGPASPNADEWLIEFDAACLALQDRLVGLQGYQCEVVIDQWWLEFKDHPRIASACRNQMLIAKTTLLKNPGAPMTFNMENSNFQVGNSQVSNSSGHIAAGDENVIQDASVSVEPLEIPSQRSPKKDYSNVAAGCVAGVLAAWWFCPQSFALGPTRMIVTVCLVVASVAMGLLSWFQFRRRNWEKFAYISLGGVLILRSVFPTIQSWIWGVGESNKNNVEGTVAAYFSFADEPFWTSFMAISGVVVLVLAFFSKAEVAEATSS